MYIYIYIIMIIQDVLSMYDYKLTDHFGLGKMEFASGESESDNTHVLQYK
jgi:hypothetical protein